nr:hypothetical protein [Streptomyces geranii]
MLVDLLSYGWAGVAQDDLRSSDRHTKVLQHGGLCVAKVVEHDLAQAGLLTKSPEQPHKVARLKWCANGTREDEVMIGWFTLDSAERLNQLFYERETSTAGICLHWPNQQLGADSLKLLFYVEGSSLEVNVLPAQPKDLSSAHSVVQREYESRV